MRFNFKDLPVETICRLYRDGQSSPELANKFNISRQTVINRLKENGIKMRTGAENFKKEKHPNWDKRLSRKIRQKISDTEKRNGHKPDERFWFKKGCIPWNKGKKDVYSQETLKQISEGGLGLHIGKNNGNWKGGITPEINIRISKTSWLRKRKKVYKRDNWRCQICGKHCWNDIQCHHIISVRKGGFDSYQNLITLCKSCHIKVEFGKLKDFFEFYLCKHMPISLN